MKPQNKTVLQNMEELKKKVLAIQEGVCELRATGLKDDLIYFAVQRAAQKHNKSYQAIGVGDIKAVMLGLEGLYEYMFPKTKEEGR